MKSNLSVDERRILEKKRERLREFHDTIEQQWSELAKELSCTEEVAHRLVAAAVDPIVR